MLRPIERLRTRLWAWALLALGLLLVPAGRCVVAQPLLPMAPPRPEMSPVVEIEEVEQATRAHLQRVQQLLAAQQWSEAVQTLRRVMESEGERLMAVPDAADLPLERYVPLRQYCHALLCRWSETAPLALAQYRQEVDPLAEQWYRQAKAAADEALLERLVDQFFASSFGDQALWLLGEYALERGDATQARRIWEQLSPTLRATASIGGRANALAARPLYSVWQIATAGTGNSPAAVDSQQFVASLGESRSSVGWLAYPDTDLPLADIRARLVLVSILEGWPDRAEAELEIVRQLAPEATGTLAGRSGRYVELLQTMLQASRDWPPHHDATLSTFGATGARQFEPVEEEIDPSGTVLWSVALPAVSAELELLGTTRLRVGEANTNPLSYHPLGVGRAVYVNDVTRIRGFDSLTGRPLAGSDAVATEVATEHAEGLLDANYGTIYRHTTSTSARPVDAAVHVGVPRYTSTVFGSWLFTRLGSPVTRRRDVAETLSRDRSVVIGLDLQAEGKLLPGFPLATEDASWSFEGAPLCDGRRLLVALRHQDDVRVESHLACYDVISGRLLWRKFLGAAETSGQGIYDELTHNLLTLHHSTVYLNSNLGFVASMTVEDGQINWLVKYPRAPYPPKELDRTATYLFRDLVPPLFYQGQLVVAPADCERLFSLEAASGQLLWTTRPGQCADANQLLGVTQRHVLASGEYLYWLDRFTGQVTAQFPPARRLATGMAAASPRGYGRGLMSADRVYWPTREAIHVFWQQPAATEWGWQPAPARAPIRLAAHGASGGHLAVADGVLLIATSDQLLALRAQ